MAEQLHAGTAADGSNHILWHTGPDGKYWTGYLSHRTPEELLQECLSTMVDLFKNHPGLINKLEIKS